MEKFAKETDIKNSDGNDLIAKANVLKSFDSGYILLYFMLILRITDDDFRMNRKLYIIKT